MKKGIVIKMVLLVSFLILATFSCIMRERPSDSDLRALQWHAHRFADSNQVDAEQRVWLAITKWQNGVMDPEPILIEGLLDVERSYLALTTFDEDADLLGFAIEEDHVDSNGVKRTLLEEYPVFTHSLHQYVTGFRAMPVILREGGQIKPEDQWQEYIRTPRQQLEEEYMRRVKSDPGGAWNGFWKDTLPPILVSIPVPNEVDVKLYVYDKAGHISERVSLLYFP